MDRRRIMLLGLGGLTAVVIAITAFSLTGNLTYFLYPTEAIERRDDFPDGERFRLAGLVVVGSIDRIPGEVAFLVTDGGAEIEVLLVGTPPPLFAEDVPVLVEGAWQGARFLADRALIRHDENYEIPEEGGGYPSD